MMYEGDAKDWEAQVHWHGDQIAPLNCKGVGADILFPRRFTK
jgi:hypothetical protein